MIQEMKIVLVKIFLASSPGQRLLGLIPPGHGVCPKIKYNGWVQFGF